MTSPQERFILGVDLDGVCADFFERIREIAAEWLGKPVDCLSKEVDYDFKEWGLPEDEYEDLHRFAVTQRDLFATMRPIEGVAQSLRRLSEEGVRIRIITYRLRVSYFHQIAVTQTVKWLDSHAVQYWDLCFMRDKGEVSANLYIEDSPHNIQYLRDANKPVLIFSNSTNRKVLDEPGGRAESWEQAEHMIRHYYYEWLDEHQLEHPPGPGLKPSWLKIGNKD
jgi:hypothetical protein